MTTIKVKVANKVIYVDGVTYNISPVEQKGQITLSFMNASDPNFEVGTDYYVQIFKEA